MNDILKWEFHGSEVRTMIKGNELWWVLADVCKALNFTNSARVLQKLKADEKDKIFVYIRGEQQEMTIISEKGLYRLIFQSNKSETEGFQDWVFGKVLPSIRKYDEYVMPVLNDNKELSDYKRPTLPLHPNGKDGCGLFPYENREYIQKTFRSMKVWTYDDAAGETGIPRSDIVLARKKYFGAEDSRLLTGASLRTFKKENAHYVETRSRIVILTEAGLAKLCKVFKAKKLNNGIPKNKARYTKC